MYFRLGNLLIGLHSSDDTISRSWSYLFGDWAASLSPPLLDRDSLDVQLEPVKQLPALPDMPPIYEDAEGILNVYQPAPDHFVLHFLDGALLHVPLSPAAPFIKGLITPQLVTRGRLEDATFTALAPLLRRRGYYLIHAFAACRDGQAMLLVGPSMSGKTTTGLSLLLDGYSLLANDVVLLQETSQGVYAWPTPGRLNVRPATFDLLPGLNDLLQNETSFHRQVWGKAAPVTSIYFPTVTIGPSSGRQSLTGAVVLARLLEQSVDRWDHQALPGHLEILKALSLQAQGYTLHLGQDVPLLPQLLSAP